MRCADRFSRGSAIIPRMKQLRVVRASLDPAKLWTPPAGAGGAQLVSAADGRASRLRTELFAWRDETSLYLLFRGEDDYLKASIAEHDGPLYAEDVFELFLAPERLERYFELEVSPTGTHFDAVVDSPDRARATMRVDRAWDPPSYWSAVRRRSIAGVPQDIATLVAIGFADLGREPAAGEQWRANFFRVDRHPGGDSFDAWCPTGRTPPDFHVPDAFGTLQFE
jgi:hypothetical protein